MSLIAWLWTVRRNLEIHPSPVTSILPIFLSYVVVVAAAITAATTHNEDNSEELLEAVLRLVRKQQRQWDK